MERSRLVLAGLLQLLAVLYAVWFYGDRQYTLALLVFALPPILLMIGVMARRRTAAFWAGVFALSTTVDVFFLRTFFGSWFNLPS